MSLEATAEVHPYLTQGPSMNQMQTLQFMKECNVQPFDRTLWQVGSSLLVVCPEDLRRKMGHGLPPHELPSVIRLNKVMKISSDELVLRNDGWINYYAISKSPKTVRRVKVGNRPSHQYYLDGFSLFLPDDTLFVHGTEAEE